MTKRFMELPDDFGSPNLIDEAEMTEQTLTEQLGEELKEIVLQIRQYLCNTEFAPKPFTAPADMNKLTLEFPNQILQACKDVGWVAKKLNSREILALKRRDDGVFEFYEDGKLTEEWIYRDPEEAWGIILTKTLRHLKNIADKRLKMLEDNTVTKRCKHRWKQKPDYPEDIICCKCETIKKVSTLTRQQFLKLPLELRRSLLSLQAEGMIKEYLPCGLFGENLGQLSRE